MTCRETTTESLTGFVDGRLDERARAALARHLDFCENCRGQVRWLRSVKAAAAGAPAPAMPADLKDGLLAQARAAAVRKAQRRRRERWAWLLRPAPVAGFGLAAGFAAALVALAVRSSAPETVVPLDDMLAAHRAYELTMPLNSETAVTGLADALAGGRP
jgi:anti-sigma factor RsiW